MDYRLSRPVETRHHGRNEANVLVHRNWLQLAMPADAGLSPATSYCDLSENINAH
jgi:hypothetical protein